MTALEALLRELVVVPIDSRPVLDRFAEFHSWTKSIGRTIGHNDLWIAATAAATGAHLVTTDADFDPLHPERIRRTMISESARMAGRRRGTAVDAISAVYRTAWSRSRAIAWPG